MDQEKTMTANKRKLGKLADLITRLNSDTVEILISVLTEYSIAEIIDSLNENLKNTAKRVNLNSSGSSEPSLHEPERATMYVVLQSGEQRLITFTVPKANCSVQELLDQVGVPYTADSNIKCIECPGADVKYVITVGMPNTDSTELLTAAENTLKRMLAETQLAAQQLAAQQQPKQILRISERSTLKLRQQRQITLQNLPRIITQPANQAFPQLRKNVQFQQLARVLQQQQSTTPGGAKGESPDTNTIQSFISKQRPNLDLFASSVPSLNDLKASLADISPRLTEVERKMSISVVDEKPIILNDGQAVSKASFEAVRKHLLTTQPRFILDAVIPRSTRLMFVVLRGGRHESSKLFLCPSSKKIGDFLHHFQIRDVPPEMIRVLTAVPCESIDWICFIDLPGEIIMLDKLTTTSNN